MIRGLGGWEKAAVATGACGARHCPLAIGDARIPQRCNYPSPPLQMEAVAKRFLVPPCTSQAI